ncbi:MAG: hypothetical protein ACK5R0_08690 [Bacteroidota bacterium]|nr:hypothetical protein [Cytophagales bacterium]
MKLNFLILVFCFSLVGCSSTRHGVKLSQFSYNEKSHNSLIVDRVPDYGLTGKDGCVVEGQFLLSLKSSVNSEVVGVVKDVESLKPMTGANVTVWFEGQNSPISIVADVNGEFKFIRQSVVTKIEVQFVGWRTMVVDFNRSRVL